MMLRAVIVVTLLLGGCASQVRFVDRPILWRDPDDLPIARPRPRFEGVQWTGFRDSVIWPADQALSLDYGEESWNVNALDEVPDSSWFVDIRRANLSDRRRPRAFTAEEIKRGAFGSDPGPIAPFTVVKGKTIGSTPGLVIVDARGQRYMFKLDPRGYLGMNTSTEVVATRLAWASGWLVPTEKIVDVRPDDLILSPDASTKNGEGKDVPLSITILSDLIGRTPRESDGTIRVCASRWLAGRPLGSWTYLGRRADDPNDRIEHQNRRDVRGFGVFAIWVNDIDTMENNTMDAYVGPDGAGHIVHYQQDVGGSFGQFAAVPAEVWMGEENFLMVGHMIAGLFTFGALTRTWENEQRLVRRRQMMEKYPELGYFDDIEFDPKQWHAIVDNPAFTRQTVRDRYWGTKRVIAFTQAELRAAVSLGHYAPQTEERLLQILWHRRQVVARSFLSDVAPLDYFHFEGTRLCFDDLWLEAGLGGNTRYFTVGGGEPFVTNCVESNARPGYNIIELGVVRDGKRSPTVRVHFIGGNNPHVIGTDR